MEAHQKNAQTDNGAIVLIDGVCRLCQGLVRFIIPRDPQARLRFAALQGETGGALLRKHGLEAGGALRTVVLIENGTCYTESGAALRIARKLSFPWPLFYAFIVVPPPLRNGVYRWVARNRYKWFGQEESCLMPSPELQGRFME